ncbi:MAG: transposase [Candidatus Accumulibacter similis]|nr:MAG: transposase [Candidatus Accumulibacter similis]
MVSASGPSVSRLAVSFPTGPRRALESREIKHVEAALGLTPAERAVLLSDGYHAYAHYAAKTGITHAQCWTHTRRGFFEAQAAEPEAGRAAEGGGGDGG